MAQARDEAGNIWELDAQGNAVRLITPAGAQGGQVISLPQNPKDVAAQSDREADNARADAAAARQAAAAEREEREWNATHNPDGSLKPEPAGIDPKAAARKPKLDAIVGQINRVQELYDANLRDEAIPLLSALSEFLPTESNRQFDAAAAGLAEQGLAAFRVPGVGAQSDAELRQFVAANKPAASNYDATVEEKLRQLRARVDSERDALGMAPAQWGGQPEEQRDETPLTAGTNGGGAPQQTVAQGTGPLGLGGGTRRISNDRANAMVNSLVNAGASEATVNAALKQMGLPTAPLGSINAAREWMKANPGKRYDAANIYQDVPLSLGERAAGTALGAGAANYFDAATAGVSTALAGERGKGALDAMNATHPDASTIGTLAGGVTGALGAELSVAARAPAWLARFAPRLGDAAYGGLSGFNAADDGEGVTGALTGAGAGVAGGFLGDRAMRATGAALRGVTDPAVQRLREAGIPLTFGRAVGNSGTVGSGIKKLEEAATSLPGVGSMISARFDEGLQGLNRAAFEVGAETTGGQVQDVGSAGLAQLRQLVGDTYDNALNPGVRLDVTDPQVAQGIINSQMAASSIPQVGGNAVDAIDYRVTGGTGIDGTMDGRDFQEAYRGLGRDGREAARGGTYAQEYQGAMGQAQDALAQGLEAQNPGAYAGFVDANTANRRAMVLADAVNAGKNQSDELFTPAQLNAADANSATRLTGRLNSASGNRPFHDLAQDAQQVMGNRLPNSGTADRAWTGLLLGGAAGGGAGYAADNPTGGAGAGVGLAGLAMLGGTRAGQRILTELLLERPAWARSLGDTIQRNAYLGGGLGSGVLTPLVVGS